MKKIVLTGATGFIGRKIVSKLLSMGDKVYVLTRSTKSAKQIFPQLDNIVEWSSDSNDWYSTLEGADAVINLAGENIMSRRWNPEQKKKIFASRVDSVKWLIEAVEHVKNKPQVFISASAIGYYGNREDAVDENSEPGNDFMASVVKLWEDETKRIDSIRIRRVNIRIGIVLDAEEGLLNGMITPFKLFVGGPLGSGRQWFAWVHIDDLINIFLFALDNISTTGILNAVSPNPVRMNEFSRTLGKVMKRPSLFRVPEFVLKILLGEVSEVVLEGAKVMPVRTLEAGYKYKYTELEGTLRNLLNKP